MSVLVIDAHELKAGIPHYVYYILGILEYRAFPGRKAHSGSGMEVDVGKFLRFSNLFDERNTVEIFADSSSFENVMTVDSGARCGDGHTNSIVTTLGEKLADEGLELDLMPVLVIGHVQPLSDDLVSRLREGVIFDCEISAYPQRIVAHKPEILRRRFPAVSGEELHVYIMPYSRRVDKSSVQVEDYPFHTWPRKKVLEQQSRSSKYII